MNHLDEVAELVRRAVASGDAELREEVRSRMRPLDYGLEDYLVAAGIRHEEWRRVGRARREEAA